MYSLAITSFSFFLFSFQVHEKTILFPLLPITLLFCEHPLLSSWMGFVATFSLYPLLRRDHLEIAYITLQLLFCCIVGGLIGSIPLRSERKETLILAEDVTSPPAATPLPPGLNGSAQLMHAPDRWAAALSAVRPSEFNYLYPYVSLLSLASLAVAIALHLLGWGVRMMAPEWGLLKRWPDALTFLFVEFSFVHFVGFFVFLYWLQLTNTRPAQSVHIHHHAHTE